LYIGYSFPYIIFSGAIDRKNPYPGLGPDQPVFGHGTTCHQILN